MEDIKVKNSIVQSLKNTIISFLLNCEFEQIGDYEFENEFGKIIIEDWDCKDVMLQLMQLGINVSNS